MYQLWCCTAPSTPHSEVKRFHVLTLTRKPGETIYVGDDIEIVVKEIRGGAVRLGIQAPGDVFIYRGELYRKIKREKGRGATTGAAIAAPPPDTEDDNST